MIQPIRIISPSFEFLGEIDDYSSLQFTRRYNKLGEFELHINLNKNLTEILQEDNFIFLDYKKVGVIRYREISRSDSEDLVIKGYSLKGILSRRITEPPAGEAYDTIEGPLETVIKHYVMNNAITPVNPVRKITNLLMTASAGRGDTVTGESRYEQLDSLLTRLSSDKMGWDVYLDLPNKKFIFDVIIGRDLTVNQNILPPVIFSIDFDNIRNQTYIQSATDYKNAAYVGGQGEDEDRIIVQVGDYSGLERIETFIDASDVEEDEELPGRGVEKLKEFQRIQSFESEILPYGPFIYEQDWDFGDIVTVQDKKLGVTLNSIVIEVKEIYEINGFMLEATFGNTIPTIIDKIKQTQAANPTTERATVPTAMSQLTNDMGYVTQADIAAIGGDATYTHDQISPSSIWTINHNLKKYPSVLVQDSAGTDVIGDIKYDSNNAVTLTFTVPFSGKAYLN